ncbi:hypothetical protein DSM112329_00386 [Paraconexibacter sp. AEG42_29]|uniref:DNA-binding protein n=1 Tax=Paraconexibacter sp. AEG42_29 TaxID=2997339 RepID=A0AAU7APP2_9ACTN
MDLHSAPVIGDIGPRPDGLDVPFWAGLAEGRLLLQRCGACATWIWGPQWVCPRCRTLEPGWDEVPLRGTVYSWTRTWQPFVPSFKEHLPYVTLLIELPDAGGRRILGLLIDDDGTTDPVIGEDVAGVIQPASDVTSGVPVLRWTRGRTATEGDA